VTRSQVAGVALRGVASAVPSHRRTLNDDAQYFPIEALEKIAESTGIVERRWAGEGLCASDLCHAAAERLLFELGWAPDSVDVLIFVSQTGDRPLPATACSLQARLGMSKRVAAFDIGLGCSGYAYALWVASSLLSTSDGQRALVLVGDTLSRAISPLDRSLAPIFGDAGTATALECDDTAESMYFVVGTDGTGAEFLKVEAGGFRTRRSPASVLRTERESGNIRSDEDLFMDGSSIFSFTLREVPPMVRELIDYASVEPESISAWVLHQANKFMMDHLRRRLKAPEERFIIDLEEWGNTSSPSIALALTSSLRARLSVEPMTLLLAGFGVGLSWSSAIIRTDGALTMPSLIEVDEPR
jgi:3-oxoacyl-[acyl-carrier-protein] synthase III